jgi:hypothetical protein
MEDWCKQIYKLEDKYYGVSSSKDTATTGDFGVSR